MNASALRQSRQVNSRGKGAGMDANQSLNGTIVFEKLPDEFRNIPEIPESTLSLFINLSTQLSNPIGKVEKQHVTLNSVMKIINDELREANLKDEIVLHVKHCLSDKAIVAMMILSDQGYIPDRDNLLFQSGAVDTLSQLYAKKGIVISFLNFSRRNRMFKKAGGNFDFIISSLTATYTRVKELIIKVDNPVESN